MLSFYVGSIPAVLCFTAEHASVNREMDRVDGLSVIYVNVSEWCGMSTPELWL